MYLLGWKEAEMGMKEINHTFSDSKFAKGSDVFRSSDHRFPVQIGWGPEPCNSWGPEPCNHGNPIGIANLHDFPL